MQKTAKNLLALMLAASFIGGPTAFAQTAPDASAPAPSSDASAAVPSTDITPAPPADAQTPPAVDPAATPAPADPAAPAPTDTVNPQESSTTVQDTTNTQPAVTADVLVQTGDPTATSTIDSGSLIPLIGTDSATTTASTTNPAATPVVDATTTPVVAPVAPDPTPVDVAAPIDEVTPVGETPTVPVPLAVVEQAPQPIEVVEAPVKPKFDFALTGKTIASKKKIKNAAGDITGEASVSTSLTSSIDNATGVMQLSGQCSDTNYVVLLYKHADDYLSDPRSYVVNTAYPCVNGAFSYSLSELPSTIPDGLYYLLVAQEGTTGGWTPITDVTEITINRTQ